MKGAPVLVYPSEPRAVRLPSLPSSDMLSCLGRETDQRWLTTFGGPQLADAECARTGFVAYSPESLERVWEVPFDDEYRRASRYSWSSAGLELFDRQPRHGPGARCKIVAVEQATGAVRWEKEFPAGTPILGANTLVLRRDDELIAIDAKTGSRVWQRAFDGANFKISDDGALLVEARGRGDQTLLVVWNTETGDRLSSFAINAARGQGRHTVLLHVDDSVLLQQREPTPWSIATMLVSLDARTGKDRWRTKPLACDRYREAEVVARGSDLIVCGCDGVLRWFDGKTGALRAQLSMGRCPVLGRVGEALVAATDALPSMERSAGPLRADDARAAKLGLVTITDRAFEAPEVELEVSGTVKSKRDQPPLRFPRWVIIGSHRVQTDSQGHFQTRLLARGVLRVGVAHTDSEDATWDSDYVLVPAVPGPVLVELWVDRG